MEEFGLSHRQTFRKKSAVLVPSCIDQGRNNLAGIRGIGCRILSVSGYENKVTSMRK